MTARSSGMWFGCRSCACAAVLSAMSLCSMLLGQTNAGDQSVDSVLRDYYSANGLLNRGMHELAIPEYHRFLQAHPDHEKAPLARYGLAVCLFRLQKLPEALRELERIGSGQDFPFAAEVSLMTGQALLAHDKFDETASALKPAAESQHDLADKACALRVESLHRAGRSREAMASADQFVQRWPDSSMRDRVRLFQGMSAVAVGDDEQAVSSLTDLLDRAAESEYVDRANLLLAGCFDRLRRLDEAAQRYLFVIDKGNVQTLPDALSGLASVQMAQERSNEALRSLNRLIREFPNHALTSNALLDRGRLKLERNDFLGAAADLARAGDGDLQLRDKAEFWLAKCELRSGEPDKSAARLKNAIAEFPASDLLAEMCFDRAVAMSRANQRDEASEAFGDFRKRFPNHALEANALYMQAALEHEQQRHDVSIALCREFLGRHPKHESASAVEFLWAESEFQSGNLVDAAFRYEQFLRAHPEDQRAPIAQFRMGAALYKLGEHSRAHAALNQVVHGRDTIPANRAALLMLGDIALVQERWDDAIAAFNDYLSFGDDQPSAHAARLNCALAMIRLGRTEDALNTLDVVIARDESDSRKAQAWFEKGQLLLAQDNLTGAKAALEQVELLDSQSPLVTAATEHLATIALREGRPLDAAQLYGGVVEKSEDPTIRRRAMFQRGQALMAAERFEMAALTLREFAVTWPDDPRAHTAQAQAAIALARLTRHEEALEAIQAIDATAASSLAPDLQTSLRYEQAWCLRELKREDEAVNVYESLLAVDDSHTLKSAAALELAELHAAANRHDQAVALLDNLVKSETLSGDARERTLVRLARSQFELKRFEQCVVTCDALLDEKPSADREKSARLLAGESLYTLGRHQPAVAHFQAVVEEFPDDASASTCLLRVGECMAATSQWEASRQAFAMHRERFPKSDLWFQSQFGLGWAHENEGNTAAAIDAYQLVVDRHNGPTAARAQFQIGECLYAQKRYEDAVRELLKVDILYAYPEWSAAALYEAGRCLEELAKPDEARAQFEQVRQRFGESKWAALAAQRVTSLAGASSPGG